MIYKSKEVVPINTAPFFETELNAKGETWLRVIAIIQPNEGFQSSYLACSSGKGKARKKRRIRLFNVLCGEGIPNYYEFYYRVPKENQQGKVQFYIDSEFGFSGELHEFTVIQLTK